MSRGIQKMHKRQQIYDMLPKIDCGACGAPTCMTFAEDVVKGDAEAEECVFLTMKTFESMSTNLLEVVGKHSKRIHRGIER
jgi:CO dehydrogenase/acetyl-CoA synthase gamma subunit (corrinoid Fe-S protein)